MMKSIRSDLPPKFRLDPHDRVARCEGGLDVIDLNLTPVRVVTECSAGRALAACEVKIVDRECAVAEANVAARAVQVDAAKTRGPEHEGTAPAPGRGIAALAEDVDANAWRALPFPLAQKIADRRGRDG